MITRWLIIGLTTPTVGFWDGTLFLAVLAVVSIDVIFPNGEFAAVTVFVTSGCCPESDPDGSCSDGEADSSEMGKFRTAVGDVYLLDGGVKCATLGAEIPFTAKIGFDSYK